MDPVQQKGSIENYRAIKDKVHKAKPTDLPNGQQMNTPSPRQQSQKGFRFEKKLPTQVNFTFFLFVLKLFKKTQQETKKPPRRCKTSMDFANTSFR